MQKIDKERIEKAVKEILIALNDNPNREGLVETPKRVAQMYAEIFEGMLYTNDEIAKMFDKCFEETTTDEMVLLKDIPTFSYCEHHLALMYNMKVSVGYIPNGKVIGLSKVVRVVDMVCKRLQLQERIGHDIKDVLSKILNTNDIAVFIEGEHGCVSTRGIKKPGVKTNTLLVDGAFKKDNNLKSEFLLMVKGR